MGDRGQVHIKDENVWLYTHWGAHDLITKVQTALKKEWRWDDPEYLARIIFDEMIKGHEGTETGFGISANGPHGDEWRIIEIDCDKQWIKVTDNDSLTIDMNFTDFLTAKIGN